MVAQSGGYLEQHASKSVQKVRIRRTQNTGPCFLRPNLRWSSSSTTTPLSSPSQLRFYQMFFHNAQKNRPWRPHPRQPRSGCRRKEGMRPLSSDRVARVVTYDMDFRSLFVEILPTHHWPQWGMRSAACPSWTKTPPPSNPFDPRVPWQSYFCIGRYPTTTIMKPISASLANMMRGPSHRPEAGGRHWNG